MWFREISKDSDVVISTRIRYARSIEGYKFPNIMTKVKKHSGLTKVLKVRKSGTVTRRHKGLNHNTGKFPGSNNRHKRKNASLSRADLNRLKRLVK